MPHRQDVKRAAEFQALGLGGEPQPKLNQVRKDLVALALEMMLRRPQHVEAELVHELGDVAGGEEGLTQPLIGIAPIVGRSAVEPDIVELDLPDIENVKFLDHVFPTLPYSETAFAAESRTPRRPAAVQRHRVRIWTGWLE